MACVVVAGVPQDTQCRGADRQDRRRHRHRRHLHPRILHAGLGLRVSDLLLRRLQQPRGAPTGQSSSQLWRFAGF